jgi:hypothetical protein
MIFEEGRKPLFLFKHAPGVLYLVEHKDKGIAILVHNLPVESIMN